MLVVNKQETSDGYYIDIIDKDKVLSIVFAGNLDLYFECYNMNNEHEEESITFEISKDNYILWELFDELYNDVKNCNVFKLHSEDFYNSAEEIIEHSRVIEQLNHNIKNKEEHKALFDGKNIRWISDDESYNLLSITPEKDKYILKFTRGEKIIYLGEFTIRVRNSGSKYNPFNILFMELYNKIISDAYDFNQIHINEYIRKLKR